MLKSSSSDLALIKRSLLQARPFWPHIVGIFMLSLIATPLALMTPLPIKIVVDHVLGTEPLSNFLSRLLPADVAGSKTDLLILAIAMLVIITLLSQLQELGALLLRTYSGEKLVLDFRGKLFSQLQRLPLTYSDLRGTSDSSYRVQYDAPSIQY